MELRNLSLLLNDKRIDINLQDDDGNTPIHPAIKNRKVDCICKLLKQNTINLRIKNKDGKTSLKLMFEDETLMRNDSITQVINLSDFKPDEQGRIKLHHLAAEGKELFLKSLVRNRFTDINARDHKGYTALFLALMNNNTSCVEQLLTHKDIDITLEPTDGNKLIFFLCKYGYYDLLRSFLDKVEVNINEQDSSGYTALHYASGNNHPKCLKILLSVSGINIDLEESHQKTALHLASENGHEECVRLLLSRKHITPTILPLSQRTTQQTSQLSQLLSWSSSLFKPANSTDIQSDKLSLSPLHLAARNSHIECMKALLADKSFNPNITAKDGLTPLHLACSTGKSDSVETLLSYPDINVNLPDKDGNSALHFAAQTGHVQCLQLLLKHEHINVNLQNNHGSTPLHLALHANHIECITALLSHKNIDIQLKNRAGQSPLQILGIHPELCKNESIQSLIQTTFNLSTKEKGRFTFLQNWRSK